MVKAWKETINIPTYEVGKPEKNPIFLEKRVYQGSSGVVYPYPVIESMADEPTPHDYEAVFLENEYIKVMILPELGGRVQMAYDKIKQRHFIYYNQVIKPALVGLAGPWISGGIEFNWPQHHRPSTYMPVDCQIVEEEDGSVTVWVNERERMFHQQGQAGFRLRPQCAYLEIQGRLYNPTETPQTFLWWANPAVAVNDAYQSVFPPDVNAVFDHGKRAVSSFPIATGTYYKMDYSAGVDISNYKNIKVPTSYMVAKSKYNFEGGYENDTQAGMLHVADHHVAPGKKQWTWGNGDFGRAWDRNLTDEDGPYIELMAGVFTENQPDFSWLMPYEEKSFVQYFMPYRELGLVKNANKDLLLNVTEVEGQNSIRLQLFATSPQHLSIQVMSDDGTELLNTATGLSPEKIYDEEIALQGFAFNQINVRIGGTTRLTWHAEPDEIQPIPDAAEAALRPEDIKTNEQLFLTGLHLEQYRHATWSALDYYEEALRRDPLDVRCNNAMGLWYIRRGRFDKAEPHLRTAVRVLQKRNLNPYDGEPLYNLALCLKLQAMMAGLNTALGKARLDEAYDWAYKSTWNAAWQAAGFMMCAQISLMRGNLDEALSEVDKSLLSGWHNHKARALKAYILERTSTDSHVHDTAKQQALIAESLGINPFNYLCLILLRKDGEDFYQHVGEAYALMHDDINNYHETALDCIAAGIWYFAGRILAHAIKLGIATPLTHYYYAYVDSIGNPDNNALWQQASRVCVDFCFPNRMEDVVVLTEALRRNPQDATASYLLGNFYYDKRQYDLAQQYWEMSEKADTSCPTVHRNLALLYFNKRNDTDHALNEMQYAYHLNEADARIFMEYDQLRKRLNHAPESRLADYETRPELIRQRDDLVLEHATLLNQVGRNAEAKQIIDQRIFHPWEGGEGKVSGQYQLCRIEMAKQIIEKEETDRLDEAIALLRECLVFPHNLGEGKLYGSQDNDIFFYLGEAYRIKATHASREDEKAQSLQQSRSYYEQGTVGPTEPAAALYYNDAKPEKIFFAALCYRALSQEEMARSLAHKLLNYGKNHYFDQVRMDYFAVSLPDLLVWDEDLNVRNRRHCELMISLGEKILKQ